MSANEATLIRKAQKGDQDAFAALVDEHQRYVYNLALRVLNDENEALDLAQETFVRAWTALPNFKGQSQFRTWLFRIVTNLCYNRLPNLRRSLNDLGDEVMENIHETDSLSDNPAHTIEYNETRKYLHQAIEGLDEKYRLLLTMRYQNELSYEEIASTLNLPLGTVKTGIFRAKEHLRKSLAILEELMDNHLTPEQENAIVDDALNNFPLVPMPHNITSTVMTSIQIDIRPSLLTWSDFALSIIIAVCIGALLFTAQNLPPIMLAKIRIEGILLYHDILVNARWLVPSLLFVLIAMFSLMTIPYLRKQFAN